MKKQNERENADFIVIDAATGEIVDSLQEGDKVVHRNLYAEEYILGFNREKKFVKVYLSGFEVLQQELENSEFSLLNLLIPYISFKDNVLRDKDGKFLKIKTIAAKIYCRDYEWTRQIIASLVEKDILKKIKWADEQGKMKNCIVVNPYLFFKGTDLRKDIAALFNESKWKAV